MKKTDKTLSVSAIKRGTVIDHIPQGQALRILQLLDLAKAGHQITLGLNLKSSKMPMKDIIKIQEWHMREDEAGQIAMLAPNATINIIQNYKVVKKIQAPFPETVRSLLACPNPRCITNQEQAATFFYVSEEGKDVHLKCKYCEKVFFRNEMKR